MAANIFRLFILRDEIHSLTLEYGHTLQTALPSKYCCAGFWTQALLVRLLQLLKSSLKLSLATLLKIQHGEALRLR